MLLIITVSFLTYVLFGIVTYNCLVKVFTKEVIEKTEENVLATIFACILWPVLLIVVILYMIIIFLTKYAERIATSIHTYIKDNTK